MNDFVSSLQLDATEVTFYQDIGRQLQKISWHCSIKHEKNFIRRSAFQGSLYCKYEKVAKYVKYFRNCFTFEVSNITFINKLYYLSIVKI